MWISFSGKLEKWVNSQWAPWRGIIPGYVRWGWSLRKGWFINTAASFCYSRRRPLLGGGIDQPRSMMDFLAQDALSTTMLPTSPKATHKRSEWLAVDKPEHLGANNLKEKPLKYKPRQQKSKTRQQKSSHSIMLDCSVFLLSVPPHVSYSDPNYRLRTAAKKYFWTIIANLDLHDWAKLPQSQSEAVTHCSCCIWNTDEKQDVWWITISSMEHKLILNGTL
jgi:hypothetical protein